MSVVMEREDVNRLSQPRDRGWGGSAARFLLPFAFRPHSLVLLAGRHHWWGSAAKRRRRLLETAGHRVLFVDLQEHADA